MNYLQVLRRKSVPLYLFIILLFVTVPRYSFSDTYPWYTEGDFAPATRIKVTLTNTLNFSRKDCPLVITRDAMPVTDINGNLITVVDPLLPPSPGPSDEIKKKYRSHAFQTETNGHTIPFQLDDLDKDGIWDVLFFMTDFSPRETKTIYLYIGYNGRGFYEHETHAEIGWYLRRMVPWWESKTMLWKLYFPTDVDLIGKRNPRLFAFESNSSNQSDYSLPYEYGSDIMSVSSTFGVGGICLFEEPSYPDSVSRPRFSPFMDKGQMGDTRYAFDVVLNGPLRSMVRVHTMNWRTGKGEYEVEQFMTAYKNKSYYTCKVRFFTFKPQNTGTQFGCGIRKMMNEDNEVNLGFMYRGGTIISPGKDISIGEIKISFEALALIVKDIYKPQYQFVKGFGENHTLRVPVTKDMTYEYLVASAWCEGLENRNAQEFRYSILKEAEEYNNPVVIEKLEVEKK